jgi:hypothetical protein
MVASQHLSLAEHKWLSSIGSALPLHHRVAVAFGTFKIEPRDLDGLQAQVKFDPVLPRMNPMKVRAMISAEPLTSPGIESVS